MVSYGVDVFWQQRDLLAGDPEAHKIHLLLAEDGVVDAAFFVNEVRQDCVKLPVVAVPSARKTLGVLEVAVPAPWHDEGG